MPAGKITGQGSDARAYAWIQQEMLTKRFARIQPMPRDRIAEIRQVRRGHAVSLGAWRYSCAFRFARGGANPAAIGARAIQSDP